MCERVQRSRARLLWTETSFNQWILTKFEATLFDCLTKVTIYSMVQKITDSLCQAPANVVLILFRQKTMRVHSRRLSALFLQLFLADR